MLFEIAIRSEVCAEETFNATRPLGTFIVIQSAFYDQMRRNRCTDFNNTGPGCYANVQPYIEGMCNGRIECSVRANNDALKSAYSSWCLESLEPHLDVFYTCAHGMQ